MMQAVLGCCIPVLAAAALAGCGPGTQTERLTVTGSSTVAPLVTELAQRFEELHPEVRVDVQTGGSSRGIADARAGLAQIGMVSRDLAPEEADLRAYPIARDGICLIVHETNPVAELSEAQIKAIFVGEILNWAEVGGGDAPISVVNKAEGRSTLELFLQHFDVASRDIKASVVIGDNQQGIKTVAGAPGAIGYVSIGTAEYEAGAGTPIKALPLNGVQASVATVAQGSFPLARTLNLVTKEEPQGWTKAFLDFAQSDAVHDIIEAQYFVPLER